MVGLHNKYAYLRCTSAYFVMANRKLLFVFDIIIVIQEHAWNVEIGGQAEFS